MLIKPNEGKYFRHSYLDFVVVVIVFRVGLGAHWLDHLVVLVQAVGNVSAAEGAGQFLEEVAHLLAVGLVVQRVHPVHPAVALKEVACNNHKQTFSLIVHEEHHFEFLNLIRLFFCNNIFLKNSDFQLKKKN